MFEEKQPKLTEGLEKTPDRKWRVPLREENPFEKPIFEFEKAMEIPLVTNNQDLKDCIDFVIERISETLAAKGEEYAFSEDRLSNFRRAAGMQGITPEAALLGFMTKHIVSIFDMVDHLKTRKLDPMSRWDEKLIDIINYLILLRCLILERQKGGK